MFYREYIIFYREHTTVLSRIFDLQLKIRDVWSIYRIICWDLRSKFWSKHQMQRKILNRIFKIPSHREHMILSSSMNAKHTYRDSLKEFLKLFKSLASSGIHTVFGWLDLLFKALHQERKRRMERISTRLPYAPLVVVVLPLFIDIWNEVFFIKTLIIMYISTNIHKPYVCDPLGPYNSIDQITPYCSTLINYPHPHID